MVKSSAWLSGEQVGVRLALLEPRKSANACGRQTRERASALTFEPTLLGENSRSGDFVQECNLDGQLQSSKAEKAIFTCGTPSGWGGKDERILSHTDCSSWTSWIRGPIFSHSSHTYTELRRLC